MTSPYADHTPVLPTNPFQGHTIEVKESKTSETYQFYVNESAKLIGSTYYLLHSKVKEWYYAAMKSDNKSMCFNGLFKKWREQV
jgi:hypothetical protein